MTNIETALQSLSPEELNALNTDPELLQEFKTKYGTHGMDKVAELSPVQKSQQWEGNGLQDVSLTPITGPDIQQAGQDAAEAIGEKGYPTTGAAVGTAIQMAPTIATMSIGGPELQGARKAAQAGELGQIGRVISGVGRKEAGAAMNAAEESVGIKTTLNPTLSDAAQNIGLPKGANTQQYLNALTERLASNEPMGPEALSQHHKMISSILSKEPKGIQAYFNPSKIGQPTVAQAAQADSELVNRLNQVIPARGQAAADYAAAKLRNNLYKGAAALTAAGLGKQAIIDAFKRIVGG